MTDDKPRKYTLRVAGKVAGRFTSWAGAASEMQRLEGLSRKHGYPVGSVSQASRITVDPQTYQEAQEDAFHQKLS